MSQGKQQITPTHSAGNPLSVPALSVNSLKFNYGRHPALKGVSVQVPVGRFVALLGANGAGKTTFFSLVTGLYSADEGSVAVMGHDLRSSTRQALASMGVVFQRATLDMDLTVNQNLEYSAALQCIDRSAATDRISSGLQQHDLDGLGERKVSSLSGGQRRRVELARALLHNPQLLLLDEPTVGLDLKSRSDFVSHVKALCETRGTGVLWATHLMDEVSSEDMVYIMNQGEILAEGETGGLLDKHDVPDVSALFHHVVAKAAP